MNWRFAAAFAVVSLTRAQPSPPRPRFEVAAIRRCPGSSGPNDRGGGVSFSPGRITITCQTVSARIQTAFVANANGIHSATPVIAMMTPLQVGPGWINSERYTITASAGADTIRPVMEGPMLQDLLEERFKLKLRGATKELPVYELTVA